MVKEMENMVKLVWKIGLGSLGAKKNAQFTGLEFVCLCSPD